jgi:hypothetical protein
MNSGPSVTPGTDAPFWTESLFQARRRKVRLEVWSKNCPSISAVSSSGDPREGSPTAALGSRDSLSLFELDIGVAALFGARFSVTAWPEIPGGASAGVGVGGLPRLYWASYRHSSCLLVHTSHGSVPVHRSFLTLQKSHARETLWSFRRLPPDSS